MIAPHAAPPASRAGGAELEESYRLCARIARQQARNFYYAFLVLPRVKRRSFYAVYAFLRHSDDISDEPAAPEPAQGAGRLPASAERGLRAGHGVGPDENGARRARLAAWRQRLEDALHGDYRGHAMLPAFHDTVLRHEIPPEYFFDLIRGAEMDLESSSFHTFEQLYRYCYRVAGVVGLICLHIFGLKGGGKRPEALRRAEACGIAFQLTNILRDLREDAERGRVYLPIQDMERFGYRSEDLMAGSAGESYRALMHFEVERARNYYREAEPLLPLVSDDCRPALWAMMELYGSILRRMEAAGFPMLRRRVELSDAEKVQILGRAWWLRLRGCAPAPVSVLSGTG